MQAYEKAERVSEQLREALLSRDTISTAKGILMARDGLTDQEALRTLVSMASRENKALRRHRTRGLILRMQRRNR
jgi:AmiR/NasT family two-component response regulator